MKKSHLKSLALLGISSGLLLTQQANADLSKLFQHIIAATDTKTEKTTTEEEDPNDSNMGYHLMTEDELMLELSADGAAMFKSLNSEGKKLALEVASMRCARSNPCKGLNACKTDQNSCLGKGSCKGQGKCAISDKNLAVKLVHDKMAQKRNGAIKP